MSKPIQDNGAFFPLNNIGVGHGALRIIKKSILKCQTDSIFLRSESSAESEPTRESVAAGRLSFIYLGADRPEWNSPDLSYDPAAPRGSYDLAEPSRQSSKTLFNTRSNRLGTELRLAPTPSINNYANRCEGQSKPFKLPADSFADARRFPDDVDR